MKIAVFVSGRGSNLKAILESQELTGIAKVEVVISDKKECPAFSLADDHSFQFYSLGEQEGMISYTSLSEFLSSMQIDLIVLAGFLKLIPVDLVRKFKGRIINIHPALLPSFGGKGMYGMNVHRAVFNSSAKVSGATVHFVDEQYDTGKIIAQSCVDISDVNSPEEIAARVLQSEHKLLPFVIKKFAEGKIETIGERVFIRK